jgi:catechol 2,3-dioxygenase-like lactoylglutathione lyase family enzyme
MIRPVLDQINLVVSDMEQSLAFYALLGFDSPDTLPLWQAHHRSIPVDGRLPTVELDSDAYARKWNVGRATAEPPAPVVLGFRFPDRAAVDEAYDRILGAGYRSQQPPYDASWGVRYAVVQDPDGNAVGLSSPRDPELRWEDTPPS